MDSAAKALTVRELHLSHGAESPGLSASAPCASSGHVCGFKLGKAVVLSDLESFTPKQSFTVPERQSSGVAGLSISPDGSYIAVFSSDDLYMAHAHSAGSVGQLQHVAQFAGVNAVHWCPGSAAVAVCCKQQADINLLVLQHTQQQQQQRAASSSSAQPAIALAPLQRLPAPRSAAAGARCAAWLPQSQPSGSAALLAAWPHDLLMYTWPPTQQGVDWAQPKVHRFLAGWPGPVRAIAVSPCPGSSESSLILATVDAQLSLGLDSSVHDGIEIRLAAPSNGQAKDNKSAEDAAGCSVRSAGLVTPVNSGATATTATDRQTAATTGSSRLSSLFKGTGVLRTRTSLITLLQPEAATAASSEERSIAAADETGPGAGMSSAGAAPATVPSPYPHVDDLLTPRSVAQSVGLLGAHTSNSNSRGISCGGSGVLSSLLNIAAQPAGSCNNTGTINVDDSTSSSDGSACLCMLQVRTTDFCSGSSSRPSSGGGRGSSTAGALWSLQQSSSPAPKQVFRSSRRQLYRSTLQLPTLPLPDLLAVHDYIAAVGSSTGQPHVTLCSCAIPKLGLQALQTITIPLPSLYTQDALVKGRLQGLLLTRAIDSTDHQQQQHGRQGQAAASSSNSSGTRYPKISDGGLLGTDDGDEYWCDGSPTTTPASSSDQQALPNVVVLLSCSEVQRQGVFANFGKAAASKTADVYLMRCKVPKDAAQAAGKQYSQVVRSSQLPQPQRVHTAGSPAPMQPGGSAAAAERAGAAARKYADSGDCIWWRSAVQQAEEEQQQRQQDSSGSHQELSAATQALQKVQHMQQKHLEHVNCHRELKHASVVARAAVGRSVSVETVGSYVSNTTSWTSLTEDCIQPQDQSALAVHCQHQQQLMEDDDEVQAAVSRAINVGAGMSEDRSGLARQLSSGQSDAPSGPAPGCSGPTATDLLAQPAHSVMHRPAACSAPGSSGLSAADSAAVGRARSGPEQQLSQLELQSQHTFKPLSGPVGPRKTAHPDRAAFPRAGQAAPSASLRDFKSSQTAAGTALHGSPQLHDLHQRQLLLLQAREQAREEAATVSRHAVAGLQASLEQRLDALLLLQQRQQQQQQEMQQQQQKLLLAQAERESALASVIASFHTSVESRLDAVQDLMRDMVKHLDRLATGPEDMEGS